MSMLSRAGGREDFVWFRHAAHAPGATGEVTIARLDNAHAPFPQHHEVRLGRGMGGKSFVIVTGEVAAVEAAVQAAEGSKETHGLISSSVVIPSPHMDIIRALL